MTTMPPLESPVRALLDGLLQRGAKIHAGPNGQWSATCPVHDDEHASLSIASGEGGRALLHCHAGCSTETVLAALGLKVEQLFPPRTASSSIVSTYAYRDEAGAFLFETVRLEPKAFRQRRPHGNSGWIWNLRGVRRVLFHLPELIAADPARPVFVVEGEKDVLGLEGAGHVATTNPCGAGKWRREFGTALQNRRVVILPDNDDTGRAHALKVARSLRGVAASIRILELPGLPAKGDVSDWLRAGGTADELKRFAEATPEWKFEPPDRPAAERPTIIVGTEIAAVTDAAESALLATPNSGLFARSRLLVRVTRENARRISGIVRPFGAPAIEPVSVTHLRERLDRAAQWVRLAGDGHGGVVQVPLLVPKWAAETLLSRNEWAFPPLEGVVEQPILRPDGTVLDRPGYDPQTGILFEPNAEFPPAPSTPSQEDARAASEEVLAPFHEFPFVADSDRSTTLAAILTIVARAAIDGCTPLFAIRATTPGSGKGLLAAAACLIGSGREPTLFMVTSDEEEMRKRIMTVSLMGAPAVSIDNVEGVLGSAVLAAALTTREISDRLLGFNRMATVPVRAVWFATGNGLSFKGDLGRRVVPVDLDPRVEHPEDREFEITDLLAHVRVERPRLVVAALTILRAFSLAGRPRHPGSPLGSFEQWDHLVRGAVIWLGFADPCAGRERVREGSDVDLETLRTILAAWKEVYGEKPVTVAKAVEMAFGGTAANPLRAALTLADPGSDGRSANSRTIGDNFRRWRGRIVGGLALETDGKGHGGGARWKVVGVVSQVSLVSHFQPIEFGGR